LIGVTPLFITNEAHHGKYIFYFMRCLMRSYVVGHSDGLMRYDLSLSDGLMRYGLGHSDGLMRNGLSHSDEVWLWLTLMG
jgi:hypothetical protein